MLRNIVRRGDFNINSWLSNETKCLYILYVYIFQDGLARDGWRTSFIKRYK